MSLVGTRPILQDELRQYELHHRARIAIKPGITGMWQVSGRSDITDFKNLKIAVAGTSAVLVGTIHVIQGIYINWREPAFSSVVCKQKVYIIPFFTAVKSFFMPFINV